MDKINQIEVTGNLTADLQVKTGNKGPFVTGTVAVNNPRQKDQPAEYFDFIAFDKTGQLMIDLGLKKGSKVNVVGRFQSKTYDAKDGSKRKSYAIVVNSFSKRAYAPKAEAPATEEAEVAL